MRETRSKDLATKLIAKIEILETAKLVPQIAPGPQLYEWSVEIDVPQEILDQIDYVVYELHQTFTEPIQVVRSRDTRFRLTRIGWGIFTIPITVHFKDGSTGQLSHDLTFESA
jgi:transcription initiation factor IIF auxiliary subunit